MKAIISVTAWERKSLWRRIPCAFAGVAVVVATLSVLIAILAPPIGIFFVARRTTSQFPGVGVAPQPLGDYSVSGEHGPIERYFGYEFEVPWNASIKETVLGNGLVELVSGTGQSLILMAPANPSGLLTEIAQSQSLHMGDLQPVFGDLMKLSPYEQYRTLLNTTPNSIHAFGPRAKAVRGETLLMIKAIAFAPGLQTGVFSFELMDKHGFQIGDPRKSKRVDLEVFGKGGYQVEVALFGPKGAAMLHQAEINHILTSFHTVMAESPNTSSQPFQRGHNEF